MSLDTTKTITSVTYNGIDIPLAGGGPSGSGQYTVTFLDYNGDIISQAKGNAGDHITLPANPSHTGLTFTGWLSPIEDYDQISGQGYITVPNADLAVGALYSGDTKIDIELPLIGTLQEFYLGFGEHVPETIDWGDGSTSTGSQINTTTYHSYDTTVSNKFTITISSSTSYQFSKCMGCITGLFIGNNVTSLGTFDSMSYTAYTIGAQQLHLKGMEIMAGLGVEASYGFDRSSLQTAIIPYAALSSPSHDVLSRCNILEYLIVERQISLTTLTMWIGSGSVGYNTPRSAAFVVPGATASIPSSSGSGDMGFGIWDYSATSVGSLSSNSMPSTAFKIKFPGSIQSIVGGINYGPAYGLGLLDFSALTSMPSFTNGDRYGTTVTTVIYISSDSYNPDYLDPMLLVVVPDSLYNSFNDTTNHPEWANLIGHFIRKSDYDALFMQVIM